MATSQQMSKFKESFRMFDKEGTGVISVGAFGEVMTGIGINATEEELLGMIHTVSHSHEITFDQFVQIMLNNSPENDSEENMLRCLKALDKKETGRINAYELKHIMLHLGKHPPKEEIVDEMIGVCGIDKNGDFDYERFIKMLYQK